ncbi:MAG: hypothetical protein PHD76_13170 [Methylacidiphilales bacterium]|nr:hypothetical protein [Candidatus Methylacidiphilales bacterium]
MKANLNYWRVLLYIVLLACLAYLALSYFRGRNHWVLTYYSGINGETELEIRQENDSRKLILVLQGQRARISGPSQRIRIDGKEHDLPLGKIVFQDTTVLPGRFKLSIDGNNLDIMLRNVVINGQENNWDGLPRKIILSLKSP